MEALLAGSAWLAGAGVGVGVGTGAVRIMEFCSEAGAAEVSADVKGKAPLRWEQARSQHSLGLKRPETSR